MAIRQVLQDRLPLRPDIQAGAGDAMNRAADGRAGAEGFDLCDFHFFLGLNMDLLYHIRGEFAHYARCFRSFAKDSSRVIGGHV